MTLVLPCTRCRGRQSTRLIASDVENCSVSSVTPVELAIGLLRDAAGFFRNVGEQNRPLRSEMFDNADVYERVADLLAEDPGRLLELEED